MYNIYMSVISTSLLCRVSGLYWDPSPGFIPLTVLPSLAWKHGPSTGDGDGELPLIYHLIAAFCATVYSDSQMSS